VEFRLAHGLCTLGLVNILYTTAPPKAPAISAGNRHAGAFFVAAYPATAPVTAAIDPPIKISKYVDFGK
jgi:hypothetical protein